MSAEDYFPDDISGLAWAMVADRCWGEVLVTRETEKALLVQSIANPAHTSWVPKKAVRGPARVGATDILIVANWWMPHGCPGWSYDLVGSEP